MHLRPDPATVRIVPWATDPTAQVIHDCYDRDGNAGAVRAALGAAPRLRAVRRRGLEPVVAPELEFYLVARNTDPDMPLKPPIGRSGRRETSRQSYSIDAVNEFDPLFEDVYAYCERMELNVDTLIHEIGAGQMEINFFHGASAGARRRGVLLQAHGARGGAAPRHVRDLHGQADRRRAGQRDARAPEPGRQATAAATCSATRTARRASEFYWYIGGLQKYMPAAMALFAPYVNSYRRLARFTAAPINIQWGTDNRTVGIRVAGRGAGGAARREPRHRRRRQPVRRARGDARLRLARHQEPHRADAPNARATPTCGDYQLPRSLGEALQLLRDEKRPARRARQATSSPSTPR